ncbi:hypothetical protein QE369_003730 [Agrobacterium larrymoorei]|uniref:Uncharacterized protein n=1 Tax=Agrobacterium larrymoorei TaxID=160699 RepID=A0AAJ2BGU4_9HYPH|nr:hypothetical protein [Agrobacterium larrymoorei]MDR6103533.1 hypothetical protein [Agrobacterium larrymoorei]
MFKQASWIIPALLIAIGCPSLASANDYHRNHSYDRAYSYSQPSVVGGYGLPSYVRGIGTYVGGLTAARFPGNGNYFYAQSGGAYLPDNYRRSTVEPRIIHINQRTFNDSCHYEAGVCVIRP